MAVQVYDGDGVDRGRLSIPPQLMHEVFQNLLNERCERTLGPAASYIRFIDHNPDKTEAARVRGLIDALRHFCATPDRLKGSGLRTQELKVTGEFVAAARTAHELACFLETWLGDGL